MKYLGPITCGNVGSFLRHQILIEMGVAPCSFCYDPLRCFELAADQDQFTDFSLGIVRDLHIAWVDDGKAPVTTEKKTK